LLLGHPNVFLLYLYRPLVLKLASINSGGDNASTAKAIPGAGAA
jgi:hypothetical protein